MSTFTIDDELILRPFSEHDAEALFALTIHSKPYLKQWLGWLDYTNTIDDTRQFIEAKQQETIHNNNLPQNFALVYQGSIVGTIGFHSINKVNRSGSVGYWIGQEHQGRGIVSHALSVLIEYGFQQLHLNRIEIRVAPKNSKSRALPERLGFKLEGQIRQAEWLYNHFVDHLIYGLLAHEWNVNKPRQ